MTKIKKMKSLGYAIGAVGLLFHPFEQIEATYHANLDESYRRHADALKKADSDTYGIYKMLKIGFITTNDPIEVSNRNKQLNERFERYQKDYEEKSKEGIREANYISAELKNGIWNSFKSVFTIGYTLTLMGALIIGLCDYHETTSARKPKN
jgi:hypothetical protein